MTFSNPCLTLLMLPTSTASGDSRNLTASSVQWFLASVFLLTHPVVTGSYSGGFEGQFHTHSIYPLCCFVIPSHIPSLSASHQTAEAQSFRSLLISDTSLCPFFVPHTIYRAHHDLR